MDHRQNWFKEQLVVMVFGGNNVKLVMHQISVDKIENPCY